jgi:hypothetical protein
MTNFHNLAEVNSNKIGEVSKIWQLSLLDPGIGAGSYSPNG